MKTRHARDHPHRTTAPGVATQEDRQRLLSLIMNDRKRPDAIRLRALELLGKSQGDFVETQDIRSDVIYHLSWNDEPQVSPET